MTALIYDDDDNAIGQHMENELLYARLCHAIDVVTKQFRIELTPRAFFLCGVSNKSMARAV